MGYSYKARGAPEDAKAAKKKPEKPKAATPQDVVGNEFLKEQAKAAPAEGDEKGAVDKLLWDSLQKLGLDPNASRSLTMAIQAVAAHDFDPMVEVGPIEGGMAILEDAQLPGAFEQPQIATAFAFADTDLNELLQHTVAVLSGQASAGADIGQCVQFWQLLGLDNETATEMGAQLDELNTGVQSTDAKRDPSIRDKVQGLIGKVPPGNYPLA